MSKSPTAIPAKAESTERNERQYQVGVVKRYGLLITVALITIISLLLSIWWLALVAGILVLVGIYDLMQSKHSVLYNYPIAGHIRYFLESYRPEIRQYFIENDKEEVPFSRQQRALVYQRAKNVSDTNAFGTLDDLYAKDKEWFLQSQTSHPLDVDDFRIMVGNERCQHPYSMSVFNISAMSFGSLSGRAIMALNQGAKMGGFAHDTGEGAISPYHRKYGGDLIWQLGTGYFGCRDEHGNFDPELFEQNATDDQVK